MATRAVYLRPSLGLGTRMCSIRWVDPDSNRTRSRWSWSTCCTDPTAAWQGSVRPSCIRPLRIVGRIRQMSHASCVSSSYHGLCRCSIRPCAESIRPPAGGVCCWRCWLRGGHPTEARVRVSGMRRSPRSWRTSGRVREHDGRRRTTGQSRSSGEHRALLGPSHRPQTGSRWHAADRSRTRNRWVWPSNTDDQTAVCSASRSDWT